MFYVRNPFTVTSQAVSSCDVSFSASHSTGISTTSIPSCSYRVMPWHLVKLVFLNAYPFCSALSVECLDH